MTALAPLLGAGVGLGIVLTAAGLRTRAPRAHSLTRQARSSMVGARAFGALSAGVLAFAGTGWPVLGLLVAAAVVSAPRMLSGARRRVAAERSEAVAEWIEMLRDTLAGAAGLEETIIVTARRPPPAIAGAVGRLAVRLEHQPLPDALRDFAAEVRDPAADLLAAALITAATSQTRDLGRLLAALVEATRAQAQMRASVDAGRAQVRSAMRLVLGVTLLFTVALLTFSREYLAPYTTVEGQLWLAVVGGVFAAALVLLVRLDRVDLPAAPLLADATPATGTPR